MSRRHYVDGPWGQIHVRGTGDGLGISVLLLHESPLSSRVYEDVLAVAPPDRRWLAPDTPGYGLSDPPPAECEIPAYAGALLAAVDALGVDRFVAAGVHTGSALALELCRQASPERAVGLAMSGVPLFDDQLRAQFLASWCPPVPITADGEQYRWALERYRRIYGTDAPAWMIDRAVTDLLTVAPNYSWAYDACFRYDARPALGQISVPVLLLDAESDMFADQDAVAAALIPGGAEVVVLPGLPGQPHLRAPQRYADEISAFVARIEAA